MINATVGPGVGAAGTPTGSVTFTVDGEVVGTVPLAFGWASLGYHVPAGAARTVVATYSGDSAFNGSSASVVRRDPVITASMLAARGPSAAGWYRVPITVTFACTAVFSPVSCPAPVTLDTSGAAQSVVGVATAADGGAALASLSPLDIDLVAPTVRVAGVKRGKVYRRRAPRPRCKAADKLSGVAWCRLRVKKRRRGARQVVVTATDKAGNVAKARVRYRLR